jgi:hypothetical protein
MSTEYKFTGEERYAIIEGGYSYRGSNRTTYDFMEHLARKLQYIMQHDFGDEDYPYLDPYQVYLEYKGLEKYGPDASTLEEEYFNKTGKPITEYDYPTDDEEEEENDEDEEYEYDSEASDAHTF